MAQSEVAKIIKWQFKKHEIYLEGGLAQAAGLTSEEYRGDHGWALGLLLLGEPEGA
jgi:hypothetical protein